MKKSSPNFGAYTEINIKLQLNIEGEGKSPVSTQFFSTELNAAYEQLKKEKGDELGAP